MSAKGVYVTYADGSRRLCATSGLWNAPLGYGVDAISEAVADALRDASYLTLFRRTHRGAEKTAEHLLSFAGGRFRRVIYSTSGGAAIDATMKLARHFWALRNDPMRNIIVGLRESYHGTMLGSHVLSGTALNQATYALDRRGIRHVAPDHGEELEVLLEREGHRVAAVFIEPILGNGAMPLSTELISNVLRWREMHGFVLVADEVATGFWRTGSPFASDQWPAEPDVLVASKALTNGTLPAAAVLVGSRVTKQFDREAAVFVHGETQAGTPPTCAAIDATLAEFERRSMASDIAELSDAFRTELEKQLGSLSGLHVTGRGLFLGVHLADNKGGSWSPSRIQELVRVAAGLGVDVHPGPGCIQLVPAYVLSRKQIAQIVNVVEAAITAVRARTEE